MSLLAPIEAKLEQIWSEVTGEARKEVEQALADVRAEVAKVEPLLTSFKTDVEAAVEAAGPGVKAAVEALAAKLLEDAAAIFGPKM
jgi:hypothetical protein